MKKELALKEIKILELTKVPGILYWITKKFIDKATLSNNFNNSEGVIEYTDLNKTTKKLKDSIEKLNQ